MLTLILNETSCIPFMVQACRNGRREQWLVKANATVVYFIELHVSYQQHESEHMQIQNVILKTTY